MAPVRLDLTTRLASALGVLDHVTPAGPRGRRRRRARHRARPRLHRGGAPRLRRPHGRRRRTAAWAPRTTPPSPACTRPRPAIAQGTLEICRGVWQGDIGARRQLLRRPAPRDARPRAAASASTTTSPSASSGCSTTAPSGSPTSTSTCTTATASSGCSGTTRGCSRSRCTRAAGPVPRHRLARRHRRPVGARARRSTSRCRRAPATPRWLRAIHAVVPPLVRAFAPDVLVTQHGCDTHMHDPLAHLALTVDAQRARPRGAARPGPRGRRRPLGRARRRRLRARRGRARARGPT